MHFQLDWATWIYLLWTPSNLVKLRALPFCTPTGVDVFTQVQCFSFRKVPDAWSVNPAQHVEAQEFGSPLTYCAFIRSALGTQSTVTGIHFGLNFSHTPESSAEPGCLSLSLIHCISVRPGKRPVSSCCVQLRDLQETLLPLSILFSNEGKKHRATSLSAKSHTTWSALPNAKGQSTSFPFFLHS